MSFVDRRALRRNRKALGASRSPPEVGWSLISEATERQEKPSALHRALPRCVWASREPLLSYHDKEWGTPLHADRRLFEFLVLEGMQAGGIRNDHDRGCYRYAELVARR